MLKSAIVGLGLAC